MHSILLTAALALGQAENQDRGADRDRNRPNPATPTPSQGASLDGNWTVVTFEKNGKAIPGIQNMQVSIKNNIVTFSGKDITEPAMRLEFGANGRVRLNPADTATPSREAPDRKLTPADRNPPDRAPADRTNPNPADRNPPDRAPADRGSAADRAREHEQNVHQGVYVLAHDYFALSVFEMGGRDANPRTEPPRTPELKRETPSQPRNPDASRDPAADRTGQNPGGARDTTGRGRDTRADNEFGGMPMGNAKIVVILRRANTQDGTGTTPRTNP